MRTETQREKDRESARKRYAKNPAPTKARTKVARGIYRAFLDWVKQAPCVDCGVLFPPYCMEFDHVPGRGIKVFGIAAWVSRHDTLEALQSELVKCDLVCAHCHRHRTHGQRRH